MNGPSLCRTALIDHAPAEDGFSAPYSPSLWHSASPSPRIVSDPARHVEFDGTGMLQAAPGAKPLTAVGETFDMDMDRRPLGDIPNMAEYKVRCTVTQLIPNRLVEWTSVPWASRPAASCEAGSWPRSPIRKPK
jgi:hypothetical protein